MSALPDTKSVASRPDGQAKSLVRFVGFRVKEQHGSEYFCGFSKRPILEADGRTRYVAAEFVKDRDSRGRPRRTPVRTETFPKRLAAADQSLDWFLSHVKRESVNGPLSRTQRKLLARRLKQSGFRVSQSLPNPLPEPAQTAINSKPATGDRGESSLSVPDVEQASVGEVGDTSKPGLHAVDHASIGPLQSPAPGLLLRARRMLTNFLSALCGGASNVRSVRTGESEAPTVP